MYNLITFLIRRSRQSKNTHKAKPNLIISMRDKPNWAKNYRKIKNIQNWNTNTINKLYYFSSSIFAKIPGWQCNNSQI